MGLLARKGFSPAKEYLRAVAQSFGYTRGIWFAPTLLWLSSGPAMLTALCWVGMAGPLDSHDDVGANHMPRV